MGRIIYEAKIFERLGIKVMAGRGKINLFGYGNQNNIPPHFSYFFDYAPPQHLCISSILSKPIRKVMTGVRICMFFCGVRYVLFPSLTSCGWIVQLLRTAGNTCMGG